jgi:hypothetical protein
VCAFPDIEFELNYLPNIGLSVRRKRLPPIGGMAAPPLDLLPKIRFTVNEYSTTTTTIDVRDTRERGVSGERIAAEKRVAIPALKDIGAGRKVELSINTTISCLLMDG